MAQLQQWQEDFVDDILREHNAADGSNFICHWDTTHMACNCISYAINVQNQALRPQDMEELEDMYNHYAYFRVKDALRRNDVEVYTKHGIPEHAHKIIDPYGPGGGTCESKMGNGPVITHPRSLLQSPYRNGRGQRKYGKIQPGDRFRRNQKEYDRWHARTYTKSRSGRLIRKDNATMSASGRVVENQKPKSSSGRPLKAPVKYNKSKKSKKRGLSGFFAALFGRR